MTNGNTTGSAGAFVRTIGERRKLEMWGVTVTLLATGAETNGRYSIIEYTAPPTGLGPPLHIHREMFESFQVVDGSINFQVGDRRIVAAPGTFVHAPPGTPHAFWNTSGSPARMIVTFSPSGFEAYLIELMEIASKHPVMTNDVRPLIGKLEGKYDQIVVGPPPGVAAH